MFIITALAGNSKQQVALRSTAVVVHNRSTKSVDDSRLNLWRSLLSVHGIIFAVDDVTAFFFSCFGVPIWPLNAHAGFMSLGGVYFTTENEERTALRMA